MLTHRSLREESERRLRVGCILDRLVMLFFNGDHAGANHWFKTPNPGLGNKSPFELVNTELGAEEVEDLITRIEHWVVAWHPRV